MSKYLREFTIGLLDHVVNDAKMQANAVEYKWNQWSDETIRHNDLIEKRITEYLRLHDSPRNEAQSIYNEYLSQKTEAYLRYINANDSNKKTLMKEWLSIKVPETLREKGVTFDNVFTYYAVNVFEEFKTTTNLKSSP